MPSEADARSMYSHITVGTSQMNRAMRFYDAVLAPLGMKRWRTFKIAISYAAPDFSGVNEPFWVVRPLDKKDATPGNGVTVAFDAPTRAAVDAFHVAALAAGAATKGRLAFARTIIRITTALTCAISTATSCAWCAT